MTDCSCKLGSHCDDHKTCDDRGERHEWQFTDSYERLLRNGRYDVRVMEVKRYECQHCWRTSSTERPVGRGWNERK